LLQLLLGDFKAGHARGGKAFEDKLAQVAIRAAAERDGRSALSATAIGPVASSAPGCVLLHTGALHHQEK
jgi:hypothetical protein